MRRHVLFVLLALLVFAAPAAAAPVLGPQAFFGARQHGPLDEKAEPANAPADYKGPPIEVLSTYVGRSAIEPTIALDKMGNAFFPAAYFEDPAYGAGGHTYLMKSSDGGKSWKDIEPATAAGEDPPRDLDPWVYGDPDFGRIFDIGLIGAGSYLSYSDDGGETWRSSAVTDPGVNDHQSIVAAIAPDTNPLLTPSDPAFPKLIYYCVNEVSRTGCTVSRDGGMSWVPTGGSAYYGAGTNPGDSNIGPVCSALTGHLQADPEGRVLQPAGHCGQPYVSITSDGGTTWDQILVNKDIRAADTHTELSSDADGNLYYVWIDPVHYLPWMATSTDHGAKWSDPVLLAPPGVWAVNFPTIVAGEAGRVAITFSGTTDPDEESTLRPWNQYVMMSTNALAAQPLFISNIANQVGDPIYRGSCRGRCGGIFDFDDIQMSPVDGTFWATSSDSCTDSNDCNAAYEGDLPSSATPGDALGFSIHQTGGPKLTGPLPEIAPATPAGPAVLGGPAQLDTVKPRVRLTLTKRAFKVSRVRGRKPVKAATRFTLRMSEPAAVTIKIQRLRGKRAKQVGVLRTSTAAGLNRLPFTGRIGRATLGRGRYRAIATARDTAGNVGRSKRVSFRVK
jgi:photosystem II stability/assembly factor-like uncharacterized protein